MSDCWKLIFGPSLRLNTPRLESASSSAHFHVKFSQKEKEKSFFLYHISYKEALNILTESVLKDPCNNFTLKGQFSGGEERHAACENTFLRWCFLRLRRSFSKAEEKKKKKNTWWCHQGGYFLLRAWFGDYKLAESLFFLQKGSGIKQPDMV